MNKQYSPLKPHRYSFHEEWLIGILVVVALFQIGYSFHQSAGIVRSDRTLSVLPIKGETVAKQPHASVPATPSTAFLSFADRA